MSKQDKNIQKEHIEESHCQLSTMLGILIDNIEHNKKTNKITLMKAKEVLNIAYMHERNYKL